MAILWKVVLFFFLTLPFASSPVEARELVHLDSFGGPIKVLENKKYFFALIEKIKNATMDIQVCMYVFKITKSPKNLARKVMNELIGAAKRGVNVEVLLEENNRPKDYLNTNNHNTAKILRNAGVHVRFDKKKVNTHSKMVIIDKKLVFIGSHNLTHTALGRSNETSLMVESRQLAEYLRQYIRDID